jgi:hypothetical protein
MFTTDSMCKGYNHVGDLFFIFLCCVFCLVCFRPVSCVSNVASFSRLSILDCSFGFL